MADKPQEFLGSLASEKFKARLEKNPEERFLREWNTTIETPFTRRSVIPGRKR